MALTRKRKEELLALYKEWFGNSQAAFVVEYHGLTMAMVDGLRAKMREAGGEFHVVKNTLAQMALNELGYEVPEGLFQNPVAVGFASEDIAGVAKALVDAKLDALTIKGGFMGKEVLDEAKIKQLASLPSLDVLRAQLLGTISAPASKLVRTLAEPGRGLAAVVKAYAEKDAAPAA